MPQAPSNAAPERRRRKVRQGVVVSNKMAKSIVVRVSRTMRHPIYQKVIQRSKKYMAHCEDASVKTGDLVRIMECRPLSRHKRWRLIEVLQRSEELEQLPESALNPAVARGAGAPRAAPAGSAEGKDEPAAPEAGEPQAKGQS